MVLAAAVAGVLGAGWLVYEWSHYEDLTLQVAGLDYDAIVRTMGHESTARVLSNDQCYGEMRQGVVGLGRHRYGADTKWEVLELSWTGLLSCCHVWLFREQDRWVAVSGLRSGHLVVF